MSDVASVKIMVIDDDVSILEIFKEIFSGPQFQVFTASDGPTAINEFRRQKYDLAFIDVYMPLMNGLEVLSALRAISPQLEVIMISGFHNEALLEQALRQGARHYLYKPLDAHDVFAVALKCLHSLGIKNEIEPVV